MENIQLTQNFFQELAEEPGFAEQQPTLQILQSRKIDGASICLRLRCSDGVFSYIHCGFDHSLAERVEEEIPPTGPTEGEKFPVIKVLEYKILPSKEKNTFIIMNYQLISADVPKIGNPTGHTGDAETFKGYGAAKRKLEEKSTAMAGTPTPKKMAKNEGGGAVLPVTGISPYITGRWRICGTVSGIEQMRDINSKKGPMKVFSFILSDKTGQSIKITAFAETAEKFHPMLHENSSYYISGGPSSIKAANKRYNSTGHDYEITLNHDSLIEAAEDQKFEAPKFVIKKVTLDKLSSYANQTADVMAVIDKVGECATIRKKDNTETQKRDIQLIDQTGTSIILTLWGDIAQGFPGEAGRVVGIKNAFVREYNGTFSISYNSGCRMEIDPEGKDAEEMREWFEAERPTIEAKSISNQASGGSGGSFVDELRLFSFFANPHLYMDPQRGIYFNSIGIITQIRPDNALYQSCAENDCAKKVTETNGRFVCGNDHSNNTFKYRYMVSMEVADICGTAWLTIFNEKAEPFFGKTAQQMGELKDTDTPAYQAIINSKLFTMHNFRCRGKNDTYNDITRVKYQVYDFRQPNYDQYGIALDAAIEKLEAL